MPDSSPRPRYQDTQVPRLYRVGCSLRRGFLTGPSDTVEEGMMRRLLERWDEGTLPPHLRPGGDRDAQA